MSFLASIAAMLIEWAVEKIWPLIANFFSTWIAKMKRDSTQVEAKKPVDEDVKTGAPRDDKIREDEKKWLDS